MEFKKQCQFCSFYTHTQFHNIRKMPKGIGWCPFSWQQWNSKKLTKRYSMDWSCNSIICKEGLCGLHKYVRLMWMVAYLKRFCLCHKGKTLALNQGFQSLGSPEFLPNWKEAWSLRWFHVTIWCSFCKQPWPFAALPVFVVATLGRPTAWFWIGIDGWWNLNRLVLRFWWLMYACM